MSSKKSLKKESNSLSQTVIMQDRRMDEVRRNFAVGIQRILPARDIVRDGQREVPQKVSA